MKKEFYEKLKKDDEIFDFLKEAALDGIWYWDLESPDNEWMSPNFWKTLGYDPEKKKHSPTEWQDLMHPKDLEIAKREIKRHIEEPGNLYDQVVRYTHKKGSTVWIRCRGLVIRDTEGNPVRMLGAHMDITRMMLSNKHIKRLKNEYETVFNGTQDALFFIEVRGRDYFRYIRNNTSHQEKTGVSQRMIEGKTPYDLLDEEAAKAVIRNYQQCVDEADVIRYEEALDLPSGRRVWHTTLTPILSDGEVQHIVGSARDITEQKTLEKELEKRANYDALTMLANRDNLTKTVEERTEDSNNPFVFIFIDLDDFKDVNDMHGHLAGDHVLKSVADRLMESTDEGDLVARLGGDEFVILKDDIYNDEEIAEFKEEIIKKVSQPIDYEGDILRVHPSVGVSRFPSDGMDYDQLTYHADKGMYKMKEKQKKQKQ